MALPLLRLVFVGLPLLPLVFVALTENAPRSQMGPKCDAPRVSVDLCIRLKVNKADNTLTIMDSSVAMKNQGLAHIVRNISTGIVCKVVVRTNGNNGCQCSFHISRDDDNTEQLPRGTEITLFLSENQSEYLEEEVIKDLVKKECGSIGYPISHKVEKEPELIEGEIQEVPEFQVIHKPNALGPDNNPLVANVNKAVKAHLRGKVDDAKMAEAGSFGAEMPCRIKDGILEMNPNNERVKSLIKMVEGGAPVELAVELLYDSAIILNKPKKSVWKRMIDRLCTFVITQCALAVEAAFKVAVQAAVQVVVKKALESTLSGDENATPS